MSIRTRNESIKQELKEVSSKTSNYSISQNSSLTTSVHPMHLAIQDFIILTNCEIARGKFKIAITLNKDVLNIEFLNNNNVAMEITNPTVINFKNTKVLFYLSPTCFIQGNKINNFLLKTLEDQIQHCMLQDQKQGTGLYTFSIKDPKIKHILMEGAFCIIHNNTDNKKNIQMITSYENTLDINNDLGFKSHNINKSNKTAKNQTLGTVLDDLNSMIIKNMRTDIQNKEQAPIWLSYYRTSKDRKNKLETLLDVYKQNNDNKKIKECRALIQDTESLLRYIDDTHELDQPDTHATLTRTEDNAETELQALSNRIDETFEWYSQLPQHTKNQLHSLITRLYILDRQVNTKSASQDDIYEINNILNKFNNSTKDLDKKFRQNI